MAAENLNMGNAVADTVLINNIVCLGLNFLTFQI